MPHFFPVIRSVCAHVKHVCPTGCLHKAKHFKLIVWFIAQKYLNVQSLRTHEYVILLLSFSTSLALSPPLSVAQSDVSFANKTEFYLISINHKFYNRRFSSACKRKWIRQFRRWRVQRSLVSRWSKLIFSVCHSPPPGHYGVMHFVGAKSLAISHYPVRLMFFRRVLYSERRRKLLCSFNRIDSNNPMVFHFKFLQFVRCKQPICMPAFLINC